MHFVGCGGNTVTRAEQLTITDTTFQEVESTSTALILNKVTNASIPQVFSFIIDNLSLIYHMTLLVKKDKPKTESYKCLLTSVELPTIQADSDVTYSIVELPKVDQDNQCTQKTIVEESESIAKQY